MIRFATKKDDLSHLLSKEARAHLVPEQMLVYVEGEKILATLALFDAGHRIIYVDSFVLAHNAPRRVPIQLLRGLMRHCKSMGITTFYFSSTSESLRKLALHHGADIVPASYTAFVPVR